VSRPVKLLVRQATLVTVNARDEVLTDADLAIDGSKIVGVGAAPEGFVPDRVLEGRDRIVLPGLVNTHTHLSMTLMRNYADDLDFWTWLLERVKPLEDHLIPADVRIGARLGIAELIRGGTTCFHDMYFLLDEVADEVAQTGLRACLCGALFDNSGQGEALLHAAVGLHERWHGKAEGRITVGLGPHSTYLCSPGYLREILAEAERLHCWLHVHVAETEREVAESRERFGLTPVQQLAELGCFGVPVVAAHAIYVDAADQQLLHEGGASVAHNPSSNLKLANGIAPVTTLLEHGVNVSLGTDGAASNNNLNLFEEMHLAALLQKWRERDAEALPAREVLRMATIRGAKTLGLDDEIGSLEPGKEADVIIVDTAKPHLAPRHDPVALLVYSAQAADVCTVIVRGRVLMQERELETLDEASLLARATTQTQSLVERSRPR
jgi:5-methylthioadenosine/S-adenosylhomocysteine deaminase